MCGTIFTGLAWQRSGWEDWKSRSVNQKKCRLIGDFIPPVFKRKASCRDGVVSVPIALLLHLTFPPYWNFMQYVVNMWYFLEDDILYIFRAMHFYKKYTAVPESGNNLHICSYAVKCFVIWINFCFNDSFPFFSQIWNAKSRPHCRNDLGERRQARAPKHPHYYPAVRKLGSCGRQLKEDASRAARQINLQVP